MAISPSTLHATLVAKKQVLIPACCSTLSLKCALFYTAVLCYEHGNIMDLFEKNWDAGEMAFHLIDTCGFLYTDVLFTGYIFLKSP